MVGKLGLNGFMAGDVAVVLRFKDVIPDSRPAVCIGETVDVETATRGTGVGPLRGTSEKPSGAGDEALGCRATSGESLIGIL